MEPFLITFNLSLVIFLVFLNGFFVAAEFAMVKMRESRVQQLLDEGVVRARFVQHMTRNLDAYLSACQLGITLASLGLGWVGESAIADLLSPLFATFGLPDAAVHTISFIIAFSIITALHIVIGELAPKSLAIRRTEGVVLWVSVPMVWFKRLMTPFIWALNGTANALLRPFGIEPTREQEAAHTEEEIRILMNASHESGLITQTEYTLVDNVFEFTETVAKDIMVPRTDMVVLDIESSFEENLELVQREKYTRYPVCKHDKDTIIGLVHIKDIYQAALKGRTNMEELIRPIVSVPETMRISSVFGLLQRQKSQLAIVVDEYGGTAGLLTIEDILEELVGEIQDEFDEERPEVENIDNGYSVDGRMLLEDVQELLNTKIEAEDIDTIGGWVFVKLRKVPEVEDSFEWEDWVFQVKEMDGLRIKRVWIQWNSRNRTEDGGVSGNAEVVLE